MTDSSMLAINKNPTRRDLLIFAGVPPVLFGILGWLRLRSDDMVGAVSLWAIGLFLGAVALTIPAAARWLYRAWSYATFPLAWLLSQIILAFIFFVVATPTAIVLRALHIDPLSRRFDRKAQSYWVKCEATEDSDPERYFRQF